MTTVLTERAPAKVNLTLCVIGRRADGYHELDSLVAFTGTGDWLRLIPGAGLSLVVDGPTAPQAGGGEDNLVLRATRALQARHHGLKTGAFQLTKLLPVAAGIGGGSSDAAAALRLLARVNGIAPDNPILQDVARATGSDVPVCLHPRARRMSGAGERIGPTLDLPPLFAVLINPRVAVSTADIFKTLALPKGETISGVTHPPVRAGLSREELASLLADTGNDLEAPALRHAPVIAEVLSLLRAAAGCRLARMSGSGATVFGLFDGREDASRAARMMHSHRPEWWIKPVVLR